MTNSKKAVVTIVTVFCLIAALIVLAVIGLFVPVSTEKSIERQSEGVSSSKLTKSIIDQIFPDSRYTIEDGIIYFSSQIQANYQTLYLEQLRYGRFVDSDEEYLAVLRAPEDVTVHAGGFYYAVAAVFDGKNNVMKSTVQQFMSDEGEISVLDGRKYDHVLFLGSTTYQGWTEAQGALYELGGGQWDREWPLKDDMWKERYAVFGNNRLVLYKRVIEPHGGEASIPPNHFEPDTELRWDTYAEIFRERKAWE